MNWKPGAVNLHSIEGRHRYCFKAVVNAIRIAGDGLCSAIFVTRTIPFVSPSDWNLGTHLRDCAWVHKSQSGQELTEKREATGLAFECSSIMLQPNKI